MTTLRDIYNKYYKNILTKKSCNEFIKYIKIYELRDEHPYFLNSPYLGLHRLVFKPEDRTNILDIFDIDAVFLKNTISKLVSSYNKDYEVSSDIFNLSMIWISHLCINNKSLNKKVLYTTNLYAFNILQYKFLSSKLFKDYRYKPNEDVMRYTIESLSNKFDIIKYKTWKNLIYNRSKEVIDNKSIHYKYIKTFKPDKEIYYTITNLQTKLRSTINIINRAFYSNLETNNTILSYQATNTIDGKKVLKDPEMFYDKVNYYINNQLYSRNQFINYNYIDALLKILPNLSHPLTNKFLNYICNVALDQRYNDKIKSTINKKDYIFYNDIKLLINQIISYTFDDLIDKKINIDNKIAIFNYIRSMYKSNRSDSRFINIKKSIEEHIYLSNVSKRSATINNLIVFFILYLFLKIFEVL